MDEKNDVDKVEDVILPGFRFHPTDEELVGFYLKRKIQQRPLSIELIKQLDIYKYDPWDLPKEMAMAGEKEWYFYCPRDRKYRNSVRPNRVTGAGFWKATGTDRPIYSSEGTKCIGLKKSLVFYKGRAAKGIKTDWMMHEFRLPSITDSTLPKRPMSQNIPANDSWAICRIFKKTSSMAQRALSHSWVSPLPETTDTDMFSYIGHCSKLVSENISCTTDAPPALQFCYNNNNFQSLDVPSYKPFDPVVCKPSVIPISNTEIPAGFMFSPIEMPMPAKCSADVASMLLNVPPSILADVGKTSGSIDFGSPRSFPVNAPQEMQGTTENGEVMYTRKNTNIFHDNSQWGIAKTVGFPFNLPLNLPDSWKLDSQWDSVPCPSEMSTSYSTNKCFTS